MQRSPSIVVLVACPHHGRNVQAHRNTAMDRLVACDERHTCQRAPTAGDGGKIFPHACPVYPSLAAATTK